MESQEDEEIELDTPSMEDELIFFDVQEEPTHEIEPTAEHLVRAAHFIGCVDSVEHAQDEIFPRLLNEGMNLAKLTDEDVAEVVGVKPSAVARWSEGSKPREWMRRSVYRYLREQVAERL